MKKSLLLSAALFSLASFASAQNWVNGGNNLSATGRIGTISNQSLAFITNNTERARFTNGGNFGIGTGSPVGKLHVNGFGSFGNRVTGSNATRALNLVDDNAVMRVLRVDATNAPAVELISRKSADGSNVAYWDFYAQPSDASFRIRDRQSGGSGLDRVTITHSDGSVGIGTTSPGAKLDVVGSTSSGNGINTSGYSIGLQAGSTGSGYGVYGYSGYLGVYGAAADGSYGVYGYSGSIGTYGLGGSYGVYGYCNDGAGTYGSSYDGYGVNGNSSKSYGGYFTSTDSYALVASTTNAYYAGVFYGHVYSSDGFVTSDKNLKTDIHDFGNAMDIINKLKPQNYLFKDDAKYASLHLPKGRHYGLLAQDLQQVLPNLVSEAPHELKTIKPVTDIKPAADGKPLPVVAKLKETKETINIKAVNYVELIPIMVKALQELKAEKDKEIADLKSEINDLKSLITKNSNGSANASLQGYLKQNIPNPSGNNTVISYYTPDNTKKAQILISDIKGGILKAYDVSKGEGQVNINNDQLPAGTYNYTLYVNSNKIDTKQMVVIK